MIYTEKNEVFKEELFRNPAKEYRGAPFWSWNCYMTKEIIEKQIHYFKQMGMGGFHIHVRIGLKNEYLSDEFMELIRYCNEKAKENGMLCWLYDEDRYPSGSAGGQVTKKIKYRSRYAVLTRKPIEGMEKSIDHLQDKQDKNQKVKGCFLKQYDICLERGYLKKSRIVADEEEIEGKRWYLYMKVEEETSRKNNQTYLDVLNPEAVGYFIETTHEKYKRAVGEDFGKSIPAIFTDEPRFPKVQLPRFANGEEDIILPYTDDLAESFTAAAGMNLFEVLPQIIWNEEGEVFPAARYHFYDHVCERYVSSYGDTIGRWCKENGIAMTGHVLSEESLEGQAGCQGEVMRFYRNLDLPGIDILCDRREFSTVKQASSSAHQYGREGVISELYGVTHWDFDFKGHKLGGDWQAALGVTTRTHHLAWASMAGESKRDYPAAIGWQSPWFDDYNLIEDHFSRVNYILTRGKPVIEVGVIHPVETMWSYMGPGDQNALDRKGLETDFQNLTKWLLTGLIDFDYISEESLLKIAPDSMEKNFRVGKMSYKVILVPSCLHLRKSTFLRLQNFARHGGQVIFAGDIPAFIDGERLEHPESIIPGSRCISLSEVHLMQEMKPYRQLEIRRESGEEAPFYLHQMREEGEQRWLFLAQAAKGMDARRTDDWQRRPLHEAERVTISITGTWTLREYDTVSGEVKVLKSRIINGNTVFSYDMYGNDSLMVSMTKTDLYAGLAPRTDINSRHSDHSKFCNCVLAAQPVRYENEEPNVFLLDRCNYVLDNGTYHEESDMLSIDNRLREQLGYEKRSEFAAQPYVDQEADIRDHVLHLKFRFFSEEAVSGCRLALEEAAYTQGELNGNKIDMNPDGYYVDECIQTIPLTDVKAGENELVLHMQFGKRTNLEWMYLLGEFGVQVMGPEKKLCKKPKTLYFGNYGEQGFPFYTGNLTYKMEVDNGGQDMLVGVPYYAGAALRVSLNGVKKGYIAFLPDEILITDVPVGKNTLEITCLGNRFNGFGQVHLIGDDLAWVGADSWRTEGNSWAEEYQLKPMGILRAPVIRTNHA